MDSKPVFFLCTGGSRKLQQISRRLKGGDKVAVPAPGCVVDYQRWMGGVDIHDQLRLQRYSIQLSFVFKKYYKSIFLGLVDIALVNSYIVWKMYAKTQGLPTPAHDVFLEKLQSQLLHLSAEDFERMEVSSSLHARTLPSLTMRAFRMAIKPLVNQVHQGSRHGRDTT
jgi:hypothetical protein